MQLLSSPIQGAPDEINLHILSFLGIKDNATMASTCKQFQKLAEDEQAWKSCCENSFGKEFANIFKKNNQTQTWKQISQMMINEKRELVDIERKVTLPARVASVANGIFSGMKGESSRTSLLGRVTKVKHN